MKLALLLITVVALGGCAIPRSEAEQKVAINRYFACLKAEIPRLDDGVSDAGTVALAAQSACSAAKREMNDVVFAEFGTVQKARLIASLEADDLKSAISFVLTARARKVR